MLREKSYTFLLSATAGFTDTAGFIAMNGLFTAHITGNLVLAGVSLFSSNYKDVLTRLILLPVFIAGVAVSFIIGNRLKSAKKTVLPVLLLIESLFLFAFSMTAWLFYLGGKLGVNSWPFILTGGLGVLAMSVQNAYMRIELPSFIPTTVMTGNVTQYSMDLVQFMYHKIMAANTNFTGEEESALRNKLSRYGITLLGFLLGSGAGALMVHFWGLCCCVFPAALILFLAYRQYRAYDKL